MFSCLTGIRKSDIEKMRWKEVQQHGEFTRIIFKQRKRAGKNISTSIHRQPPTWASEVSPTTECLSASNIVPI